MLTKFQRFRNQVLKAYALIFAGQLFSFIFGMAGYVPGVGAQVALIHRFLWNQAWYFGSYTTITILTLIIAHYYYKPTKLK